VADPRPASGAWRLTGHRLGDPGGPGDEFCVLVLLDEGGTLTFSVDDVRAPRGIGGWRHAGTGRVVVRAELFVRGPSGRPPSRVVVRAAAELRPDGASARVRLLWQLVGRDGSPSAAPVGGEGIAELLRP
jgi:hypothetical protein